jgi:hypothetical protein
MAKYSKKLVNQICSLIKEDSYTIAELCLKVGISERSFYEWKTKYAEFAEAIKRAEDDFNSLLVVEAKKSLVKLVKGYTIQEKRTVTIDSGKKNEEGKPVVKVKEHTVTDKYFQPNPTSIIFTLTNRDPDNWKNRQDNNITGDITLKSELEKCSDEELENIIRNGKADNGPESEDKT